MAHDTHILDGINYDLTLHTRDEYLEMTKDWTDPCEDFIVEDFQLQNDEKGRTFKVVREDLNPLGGTKGRLGELLMSTIKTDTITYVAPRQGHAPAALAILAKKYNKRLVLFAPARQEASTHQMHAAELGGELRWVRSAAMPNLNREAKAWADRNNATFFPFGLKHPLVTAVMTRACDNYMKKHGQPKEMWTAISTGVMSRSMQVGWPDTDFHCVAVARNIKGGEAGRAKIYSHPYEFGRGEDMETAPFPSVKTYDLKVLRFMREHASDGAFFWNTGRDHHVSMDPATINSYREWGDRSDLLKP